MRLIGEHYAASPRLFAINVWRYRELLGHLVIRTLKAQYKQSLLGYSWLLVNPLVQLLTLTFVFSTLLKTPSQGVPFALFLYAGLLPWLFFSSAVLASSESVLGAYNLVTSVYFPRELLVVAAVLSRVADLLAGSVIFVALLLYHGYMPDASIVWLPLVFALQMLFTIGLGLPVAALNLFFHDVRFLVGVGLNLWFFVTPVMYPPDVVPDRYRLLYDLNPLARFIASYRGYAFAGESPDPENLLVGAAMAVAMLVIGFYLFKRLEPHFADRI
ncbi:MAG TPA: ABC transporter permease [Dehalococcoidia bacterium]|nr:ABC transporter permease [Dehalococcoidia bacterium]